MRAAIRPLRALTRRQLVALGVVTGLATATAATAVTGLLAYATALVGVLGLCLFVAALQLRRRVQAATDVVHRQARATREVVVGELRSELRSLAKREAAAANRLEVSQRRILAAVETERLAASDRHRDLLAKINHSVRDVAKHQRDQTREVEALLQLYRDLRPRAPMPPSGRWAMEASGLLELLFLIEQQRPKLVLELGSGTSSVWIGYALERAGGRLVTVDHAPEFADRTRSMLSLHALEDVAEVRHAPLRGFQLNGKDFRWYDEDSFGGLSEVGLLVVDGPPGSTGPSARYPALHVLEERLSDRATVVLDDAGRPDEQDIVQHWVQDFPCVVREREIYSGRAVLSYSRT